VTALRVEVVARPVKVDRQEIDSVEAVLIAIALHLDEERLLRDSVRGVRLLRIAVPELLFTERDRRELRVGTDRPDLDELVDPGPAGLLDEVDSHRGVGVEEPPGIAAIGSDAADLRSKVDD